VLVVIHSDELDVLLLERADAPGFWQSVTGSKDSVAEPLVTRTLSPTASWWRPPWNVATCTPDTTTVPFAERMYASASPPPFVHDASGRIPRTMTPSSQRRFTRGPLAIA